MRRSQTPPAQAWGEAPHKFAADALTLCHDELTEIHGKLITTKHLPVGGQE